MKRWILYVGLLGFAVYWASNLLLWFPWSYSSTLGITLMLTLGPILWAYATFLALKTYPKTNLINGALIISLIFLLWAIIMDYIFFGLIRKAMEQLYHPTTFYGYGFLIILPFILILIFKNKILRLKRTVIKSDIIEAVVGGIACFGILTLIIILGIEI